MATLKVTNIKNESFAGDQLYLKTDGKIGIGTTSPETLLEVSGSTPVLRVTGTSSTPARLDLTSAGAVKWSLLSNDVSSALSIEKDDAAKFVINTSGNVGIGTSSPTNLLEISGGLVRCLGTASARFTVNNGAAEGFFGWNSGTLYLGGASALLNITASGSNNIQLETNSSTRMTIKSDGDVEVGGNLKTNNLPGRNLVINGACMVAQRGTSSSSTGYRTVDRFKMGAGGTDELPTQHQGDLSSSDTGPWAEGFRHSYYLTNGNQTGGAGAADYIEIQYKAEARDLANSSWEYTSSSSYITLSFWIKSSVAQNFYGFIFSADGTTQRYIFETGSLTANTWTKITKTIPGGSNVQFDDNAGEGLIIKWIPFYGTDKTNSSVATLSAWANYNGAARTPDYTSTWYTTNNSTFWLTGIQLEVGSIATKFDHKSYAEELARCQRYYWQITQDGGSNAAFLGIAAGYGSGNYNLMCLQNPVEMRVPCDSVSTSGTAGDYQLWGGNAVEELLAVPSLRVTNSMLQTSLDLSYGTSAGEARVCRIKASTSAYLGFNAEL